MYHQIVTSGDCSCMCTWLFLYVHSAIGDWNFVSKGLQKTLCFVFRSELRGVYEMLYSSEPAKVKYALDKIDVWKAR